MILRSSVRIHPVLRPALVIPAFGTVVLDQAAKALVAAIIPGLAAPHEAPVLGATIIPGLLTIEAGANAGLALGEAPGTGFLAANLTLLVILAVIVDLALAGDVLPRRLNVAMGLIVGGALGNLIDRVRLGYAIDYIAVHLPVLDRLIFNLADVAVVMGLAAVLFIGPWPWLRYWSALRAERRMAGRRGTR